VKMTYGHDIVSSDDPYFRLAVDAKSSVNNSGPPGSTPVDLFPFCECGVASTNSRLTSSIVKHFPTWFPGTYYAEYARKWLSSVRKFHDFPYGDVRRQMVRLQSIGLIQDLLISLLARQKVLRSRLFWPLKVKSLRAMENWMKRWPTN
jgi:hypothetical protein